MPGNCDTINGWIAMEEQRQADALAALNAANESARNAVAALAAAQATAASCSVLVVELPAYLICEGAALAGVAACMLAVKTYGDQAAAAAESYKKIQNVLDMLNQQLDSCKVAASSGDDAAIDQAIASAQQAQEDGSGIVIPTVDASSLNDANTALAAADSATNDAVAKKNSDAGVA